MRFQQKYDDTLFQKKSLTFNQNLDRSSLLEI